MGAPFSHQNIRRLCQKLEGRREVVQGVECYLVAHLFSIQVPSCTTVVRVIQRTRRCRHWTWTRWAGHSVTRTKLFSPRLARPWHRRTMPNICLTRRRYRRENHCRRLSFPLTGSRLQERQLRPLITTGRECLKRKSCAWSAKRDKTRPWFRGSRLIWSVSRIETWLKSPFKLNSSEM